MDKPQVKCYSGYTYAERPRSFTWRSTEYEVSGLEKAWLEPGKRCFEVSTGDNRRFHLCYHEAQDRWSVTRN